VEAGHGQEAVAHLEAGLRPDLILLDLMMPVMDGFAFRREQLKNEVWALIPVVILSADGHVKEKLEKIGGAAYLRKPPDLDDFLRTVATHAA